MYTLNLNLLSKIKKSALLLFITSIIVNPVSALKSDVEKPVHIDADSVIFNKTKGLAVYEGNVSIVQGTLEIKAYRIEINALNNEISKITAKGSPVKFQQKMDDGKMARGTAKLIQYQVKAKRLVMDGNASLSQGSDTFNSNHVEYSISSGELKAGKTSKTAKTGRVKAIFYPTNKAK
ncbi:MAG: lipopolysaccharide transport periplasmic protein LptA [Cocleimonas sp.]